MIEKKEDKKAQNKNREINSYIYVNTIHVKEIKSRSPEEKFHHVLRARKYTFGFIGVGLRATVLCCPHHSLGPRKIFLGP